MKGRYQQYHNKADAQGRTRLDRELEETYAKSAKDTDERIMKMMEEDWTVGDVPETFRHLRKASEQQQKPKETKKPVVNLNRAPGTVLSRKAASALAIPQKATAAPPKTTKPQPKPTLAFLSRQKPAPLSMSIDNAVRNSVAEAASRSGLGYSGGRSASGALKKRQYGMTRSVSNLTQGSEATITPARFAQKDAKENDGWKAKLSFLSAFDVDDEELEPGLRGALPECLRKEDEDDEEFVMTLGDGTE